MEEIEKYPLPLYSIYLTKHLARIYDARKKTNRTDWNKYSDLLIDKFAIHSSTLFHLINGNVLPEKPDPNIRKIPYDLFSVNSLLRVLIETYITFNHIFVLPKSEDEKQFRFLLWQLDGLLEQRKFNIEKDAFEGAEAILNENQNKINGLFEQIEATAFYKTLPKPQLLKIFKKEKQKVNWKFTIGENSTITPLKIIELVELTCVSQIYVNLYRYTSTHTHSGFVSIEHFEKIRGKQISDNYVNPLVTQAIILAIFLIKDICSIDINAQNVFLTFSEKDITDVLGINHSFKKKTAMP